MSHEYGHNTREYISSAVSLSVLHGPTVKKKKKKFPQDKIEILSKLRVQRSQLFAAPNKLIDKTKLPKSPNKKKN